MNVQFKKYAFAVAAAALLGGASNVHARGELDFLDPCIAAKDDFAAQRNEAEREAQRVVAQAKASGSTDEFRQRVLGMEPVSNVLKAHFEGKVKPEFEALGAAVDYQSWVANSPEVKRQLDELYVEATQQDARDLSDYLANQKRELDGSCPNDALNQTARVLLNAALAPFNIIDQNFKAAERESGEIAKGVRAVTGVSVRDIQKHGLAGGRNSEVRKAGRALGIKW